MIALFRHLGALFLVTALALPALATDESYPALARQSMSQSWKQFKKSSEVLRKTGFLPHETKDMRKRIGILRESLDLFVYSYWYTKKQDPWMQIRDFLDEGYELIGTYKDLYDIQNLNSPEDAVYNRAEVEPLRREIQNWWTRWERSASDVYIYLMTPSQENLYPRSKKELSRFYWGASELIPDLSLSGEANLARLCSDLLGTAAQDWPTVQKIKNPLSSLKEENQFHDFRKRLRSVARIIRTFPRLYLGTEEDLIRLEKLSDRYGAVNDKITAAHRAENRGQDKKAKKIKEQVKDDWQELLKQQVAEDIPSLLNQALQALIH